MEKEGKADYETKDVLGLETSAGRSSVHYSI